MIRYSPRVSLSSPLSSRAFSHLKCTCVHYELADGSFICVRPSGTEPKLKVYYSVRAADEAGAEAALEAAKDAVAALLEKVK